MTGVDFPLAIGRDGRTSVVDRTRHVRGLIEQLLFTAPGERVHRPDFGTGLHQLVFEPGGDEVAAALQFVIQGALQRWLATEIDVKDVEVAAVDSSLVITVRYVQRPDTEVITETFTRPGP